MDTRDISKNTLIMEYYDAILAHCNYKLNFDTIAAHEITQETFFQFILHWDKFKSKTEAGLVTWLYKTADILIKKHLRIKKSEEKILCIDLVEENKLCDRDFQIDKNIITEEEYNQYAVYIDTIKRNLTEKERLIFDHVINQKHNVAETAQTFNMKENTVMVLLYRARKKAKKIILTQFPDIKNNKGGIK